MSVSRLVYYADGKMTDLDAANEERFGGIRIEGKYPNAGIWIREPGKGGKWLFIGLVRSVVSDNIKANGPVRKKSESAKETSVVVLKDGKYSTLFIDNCDFRTAGKLRRSARSDTKKRNKI